jgi:hypothetical protein
MGTGAMGQLRLVAVRAFGETDRPQMIMGAARGCSPGGMSSLGIWHELVSFSKNKPEGPETALKVAKSRPTIIGRLSQAIAICIIAIRPAGRANTLTVFAARPLHR